ncbi:MAG: ribonuclease III [Microgenomates group bacterium]
MKNLDSLKKMFKDEKFLDLALTHRSWLNEHKGARSSNERLEFLGDAVLEFIVSRELYKSFPDKEEGFLTALRANLVNTTSLADIALNLNLGEIIYLSKGEEETGGRENPSLLADTVEAIIGALFIDQGLDKAAEFIHDNLLKDLEKRSKLPLKDSKSLLQEYVQAKGLSTPRYKVIEESGPDHDKRFIIEVLIGEKSWGRGEGKSKAQAEQEAAKSALAVVQYPDKSTK